MSVSFRVYWCPSQQCPHCFRRRPTRGCCRDVCQVQHITTRCVYLHQNKKARGEGNQIGFLSRIDFFVEGEEREVSGLTKEAKGFKGTSNYLDKNYLAHHAFNPYSAANKL